MRAAGQTEVPHDVLDDYHRAIDHHAEIQCAQGEKIGWDLIEVEANGGEEQGERNRQRHDNRATKIAEKEKENYRNEQHALGQVVKHRVSCQVQEVAAIQERHNSYAGRKNLLVQLLHLLMYSQKRLVRVRALPQEDDSLNNIIAVQYGSVSAANSFADLPQTNLRPLRNTSDVFRANRGSVLGLNQRLFDIAHAGK